VIVVNLLQFIAYYIYCKWNIKGRRSLGGIEATMTNLLFIHLLLEALIGLYLLGLFIYYLYMDYLYIIYIIKN